MTKAERYAEFCTTFLGAPIENLDDRWTAQVTSDGGLQLRQDRISKGKLSPIATMKLFEFIEETYIKQIDHKLRKEKSNGRKAASG